MSLRYEQFNALKRTQEFLRELMAGTVPLRKGELRDRAYRCIKHFPHLNEHGKPMWSQDEFTDDDGQPTRI